jgi:hypothetical protein
MVVFYLGSIQMPPWLRLPATTAHHCILWSLLRAGNKSHLACSFPLSKWLLPLLLFSLKWKHWRTLLALHSTVYPPSLLPIKGTESLIIHRHIHSSPSFEFLLRKNSLLLELKSPPPLYRLELWSVRSLESPSSFPNIHGELPCITATARSNSDKFIPWIHVSHSLQSLHSVHATPHTKTTPNFMKNCRTLHQHPYLF